MEITGTKINGVESNYVVAPEAAETAGCISYWRMSGPVARKRLVETWEAEGLDAGLLPEPPEAEVALRRAVIEQQERRRLVRPLAKRGAWVIKDENVIETGDGTGFDTDYVTVARIVFDESRAGVPARIERGDVDEETFATVASGIFNAYVRHRSELAPEDVSSWLIGLAKARKAASLRDSGGVYFVPRPAMDFWRAAVRAIEAASEHRVFKIPALKNDEAVAAILDAVTQEAQNEAEGMECELLVQAEAVESSDDGTEAERAKKLGARALRKRGERCEAILEKIGAYENLLGVRMEALRARVETLAANAATARLLAESEGQNA